jgi:TonB family protein
MRIIYKALGISLLIHLVIIISLMVFSLISASREHYTPVYQVSLVVQPEPQQKKTTVKLQKKKSPPKESPKPRKKATPSAKKPRKKEVRKRDTKKEQSVRNAQRAIDEIKKRMASRQKIEEEQLRALRIIEAKRNAYFDAIAAHIQANWSLLKNQMEDVGILTTDIGLQIQRDGTISKIVIEKPSGNALFDEFAVRAVKRSIPLPPFPKELKEGRLEVTIGLSS